MLASLKRFLSDLTGEADQPRFAENDYRLAAAALLVHATAIDGNVTDAERNTLAALVRSQFDLDAPAAAELIREAVSADHEAVDLYGFTSLINRACDDDGRRRIVEMMWEVVYADGKVGEFEDNLLWRVADLLNISSRERIELRRHVAAAHEEAANDKGDTPARSE